MPIHQIMPIVFFVAALGYAIYFLAKGKITIDSVPPLVLQRKSRPIAFWTVFSVLIFIVGYCGWIAID